MYFISRAYNNGERWPKPKEYIWLVLGAGLIYAGLDELAEIHERAGYFIEKTLHLPYYFGDLVTLGYAFVGLAAIGLFFWLKRKGEITIDTTFGHLYLLGIAVFGTAQFFDTFDVVFRKILMVVGVWLSGHAPGFVNALFTFWYDPRLTLNSVEEIYECTAALLFFLGTVSMVWKRAHTQTLVSKQTKKTILTVSGCFLPFC